MPDMENREFSDQERLEAELEESKKHYSPRPKWQLILAWVLFGIVVLGILNICYWEIFG